VYSNVDTDSAGSNCNLNITTIIVAMSLETKPLTHNDYEALSKMEMGKWVMGHGSNGSPFLDGSRGSWVNVSVPLTNDGKITAQQLANFCS